MKNYLLIALIVGAFFAGWLSRGSFTQWAVVRQAEKGVEAVERVAKSKAKIRGDHEKIVTVIKRVKDPTNCFNQRMPDTVLRLLRYQGKGSKKPL